MRSIARFLCDSCASYCAQSLTRQLKALVDNHTSPGGRHFDNKEKLTKTIKSQTVPQRHRTSAINLNRQLPVLLTSPAELQTVFTQHQLDTALYGYDKCNSPKNQATINPALSGLRPTGLSYGIYLNLLIPLKPIHCMISLRMFSTIKARPTISDIRAIWRSGLNVRMPECQKLKMAKCNKLRRWVSKSHYGVFA